MLSQILLAQTPEASHKCESIQQKYQREKLSNSDCEDEAKEGIYIISSESNDETESFVNDIALWPEYLTDAMLEYYVKNPPKSINGSLESSSIRCNEGDINDSSLQELKCYEQDLNLEELKNEVVQLTSNDCSTEAVTQTLWTACTLQAAVHSVHPFVANCTYTKFIQII
ncbi:hypothetical protein HELRODRAFT_178134 [Helobdella robusta]|uniref:Uncharacterized protein n=1 Tax=Helobdella robusta TaxID=6412 RepID=T1FCT4_HELRO|nr:hypothetical protein HELRODRAFT_178134 [Helobdella robusta]ESN97349.1 hypothetical protein HELRODRAFT_178134 [Helobdella robusta]